MSVQFYNSKLLFKDGALAFGAPCCCCHCQRLIGNNVYVHIDDGGGGTNTFSIPYIGTSPDGTVHYWDGSGAFGSTGNTIRIRYGCQGASGGLCHDTCNTMISWPSGPGCQCQDWPSGGNYKERLVACPTLVCETDSAPLGGCTASGNWKITIKRTNACPP